DKSRRRHLENLPVLKHRERVVPLRGSPVIPEFPEPAANPAGEKKPDESAPESFREIADERRQAQPAVDRVEQQDKSEPDEREAVGRDALRQRERQNQARSAADHHHIFSNNGESA